jgi:hypothetical protein
VRQRVHPGAEQLLGWVAEHRLDRRALVADQPVGVDDGEHVGGLVDQGAEALLALT